MRMLNTVEAWIISLMIAAVISFTIIMNVSSGKPAISHEQALKVAQLKIAHLEDHVEYLLSLCLLKGDELK